MPAVWKIPKMTDPLGRHWKQPKDLRDRVGLFFEHVTISEEDFYALSNYESSKPSGVYPGKVWRRNNMLCWYGPTKTDARGEYCNAVFRRALLVGPGTNLTYRSKTCEA